MVTNYGATVRALWCGLCTVYQRTMQTDESIGRTVPVDVPLFVGMPCRLSHTALRTAEPEAYAAKGSQGAVLYLDNALHIPEGSRIIVQQNNVKREYVQSGPAAAYSTHQEIPLELFKGWT